MWPVVKHFKRKSKEWGILAIESGIGLLGWVFWDGDWEGREKNVLLEMVRQGCRQMLEVFLTTRARAAVLEINLFLVSSSETEW